MNVVILEKVCSFRNIRFMDKPLPSNRAITSIVIPTRDRLSSLVSCMESYLENCARHRRSPEFVIADDSSSTEATDRTKAALRRLAHRFNAPIRYAACQEKIRYAEALAAESAVPDEIVRFALFGDERCSLSTGANRNSLLLDCAGSLVLSVDDDTFCRMTAAPQCETELSLFPGYDPTEFWFFADRDRAIQSVSSIEADVLTCHEGLLGCVVRDSSGTSARVSMTLHGLVGDSGMASPSYYLTLTGASRDRLVASPQAYRSAMKSREILRCVRKPTLIGGPFCMTTFLGLDNRLLLPPFFPVQRNSDGIFGLVLQTCLASAVVAFLPWILYHAPDPPRVFAPGAQWEDTAAVRLPEIVMAALQTHQRRNGRLRTATRLVELGRHLRRLGCLSRSEFEAHIRSRQNIRNFGLVTVLQNQLQTYGASPKFWADDVKRMLDLLSKASTSEDYLVPRDLRQDRDFEAARLLTQELVARFGELLEAWPAIMAAAQRLRVNGSRLAAEL